MLEELGHADLVLPALVGRGLEANDRAKYFLSLLQAARAHADRPDRADSALREERLAAGVTDASLDRVVPGAARLGEGRYAIPRLDEILDGLFGSVEAMLAPLAVAGDATVDAARLDALRPGTTGGDGSLPGSTLEQMASAGSEEGDSVHRLILDTHRALNRLQRQIATANLDGAAVYGLGEGDAAVVAAFMRGVRATAPLKFDHPGLATTATRVGGRLLIQNDLGTTGAHVVVVAVEGLAVTVTYSDVHRRRLVFFQGMLEPLGTRWSAVERLGGRVGAHHLSVGRLEAADGPGLLAAVERLGSRLVFVLDWNRARKALAALVGNDDAVALLRWAADGDLGHIGFLQLGGERFVYRAVELASRVPARYGEPLRELLGQDATVAVARFALQAASEGLVRGKSRLLIRDELRVEVLRHVRASRRRLLEVGVEHAARTVETAQALQRALVRLDGPDGEGYLVRTAARAAVWEHRADELLLAARDDGRRVEGGTQVVGVLEVADDAVDALEEAVFLLTLLPSSSSGPVRGLLEPVAAVAVAGSREWLKAVATALEIVDGSGSEDLEDFLVAIDRVSELEHRADALDRRARAGLVVQAGDFRSLYVADRVSTATEEATDALLRAAIRLREHVLDQVGAR